MAFHIKRVSPHLIRALHDPDLTAHSLTANLPSRSCCYLQNLRGSSQPRQYIQTQTASHWLEFTSRQRQPSFVTNRPEYESYFSRSAALGHNASSFYSSPCLCPPQRAFAELESSHLQPPGPGWSCRQEMDCHGGLVRLWNRRRVPQGRQRRSNLLSLY